MAKKREAGESGLGRVAFGGGFLEYRLRRSKRKTLAITVRPDASVLVTAPWGAGLEAVAAKVRKRAVWIRRQQAYFTRFLPKLPPRQYVSGETHRYLGRQYRLKVVRGPDEGVKLRGRFIWAETPRPERRGRVQGLVEAWYVLHARARFARSLAECVGRFHGSVPTPRLQLRRMPKRWGSWTPRGVIYLNPELVLAPPSCIDYVVTHELCHLLHAAHVRKSTKVVQVPAMRLLRCNAGEKRHVQQIAACPKRPLTMLDVSKVLIRIYGLGQLHLSAPEALRPSRHRARPVWAPGAA